MRKDRQWLKEKLNTEKYYRETNELKAKTTYGELYDRGVRDGINAALEFVNQLDEPEKPIIPKFVANYIEKWKYEGFTIYEWFSFGNSDVDDDDVNKWLYNNLNEKNRRREYLLIDAIRYGYEVEKEKLYHVRDNNDTLLCKVEGKVMTVAKAWYIGYEQEFYHLTEKEIKDYDERYWAFAEEVTE